MRQTGKRVFFTTSWDDGNKSDLKVARILKKHCIKGTFYIPIHWKYRTLNDKDIKKLSKNFEIGFHGFEHKNLTKLNKVELKKEILESKKLLEKTINKKIVCFAYPFGIYNKNALETVKSSGYKFARTDIETCLEKRTNPLLSHISVQVSNKPTRYFIRFFKFNMTSVLSWHKRAKLLFDKVLNEGGIFHISGHSWEIEKNDDWEKLIDFFDYAVKHDDVIFLNNSEIVRL